MALRCVHTFCELCLEQLLRDQMDDDNDPPMNQKQRRNKRQQLICPTCETVTQLGRGCTPSSLPVNPSIMELLEIFDRPASGGRNAPVHSKEVALGYSQVKVNTTTSHHHGSMANGHLNQEPNSTLTALKKNKKEARYGLDPANSHSYGDANVDKTSGGPVNNANWVSTVNIGGSASLQQQKQQQQQQHGSPFSAPKMSHPHATMTSAVTSVSTMKTNPQKSSSTLSSDINDTNVGPTSTAADVTHMCCRCCQRPATVSVASSSQTKAPQKLCSDCWNQPVARKNGEHQKREVPKAGTEQTVRMTAGTNQPEGFSITTGKVSTAKSSPRSGVSASEALKKRQTNEPANTRPQIVKDDSAATKNTNNSATLNRETPSAGFVANGTSTIEVRRRSAYADNRGRTAQTSTPNSDRYLTTDTTGTGTTVDQTVQSATVQTPSASTGSNLRQTLAINVQQRSAIERTPPDAQRNAVPEAIPEEIPANSGSNVGTSGNTIHHRNTVELGEQGIVNNSLSSHSSAPSIAEIHPLPCSNPPYNPDFGEDSNATWSVTQRHLLASDTPAAGRVNRNPPETRSHEQRQRKQQSLDIPETTNNGLAMSFLLTNSRHVYPEQPPKYEDIIHDDVVTAMAPEAPASQTQLSQAVQPTPNEPVAATATPMKLVRSFGKYGEMSTQPGAFRAPGRIGVSPTAAVEATTTRLVVGDSANGTVQVFGDGGECLSMFRAHSVRGCCLLDDNHKLLLATSNGVEVSCVGLLTIFVIKYHTHVQLITHTESARRENLMCGQLLGERCRYVIQIRGIVKCCY